PYSSRLLRQVPVDAELRPHGRVPRPAEPGGGGQGDLRPAPRERAPLLARSGRRAQGARGPGAALPVPGPARESGRPRRTVPRGAAPAVLLTWPENAARWPEPTRSAPRS